MTSPGTIPSLTSAAETRSALAALADMTPNHFCRCFRELSGKTPFEYITDYRLSKAKYALISTEMSVTEIALLSGFGDVSRFISLFKLQNGMTPKRWRAMYGT